MFKIPRTLVAKERLNVKHRSEIRIAIVHSHLPIEDMYLSVHTVNCLSIHDNLCKIVAPLLTSTAIPGTQYQMALNTCANIQTHTHIHTCMYIHTVCMLGNIMTKHQQVFFSSLWYDCIVIYEESDTDSLHIHSESMSTMSLLSTTDSFTLQKRAF